MEKDKEILKIANELKAAYKKYYSIKLKKPYSLNKRTDNIEAWTKAATVVYNIKADPEEYIRANFKFRKDLHIPVNTLHGPTAQQCYRRAQMFASNGNTPENIEKDDSKILLPPSHIDILSRIADLKSFLAYNGYNPNLSDIRTRHYVLSRIRGLLDPLAVMLLAPDPEMKEMYGEDAVEILNEEPCLKTAIKELDLSIALNYIIGGDENQHPKHSKSCRAVDVYQRS